MTDNASEWLASVIADVAAIDPGEWFDALVSGLEAADPNALLAVAAIALATAGLAVLIYRKWPRPGKLQATLDRISFLRVPPTARDELIHQSLLDDLLSDEPSPRAQAIAQHAREIGAAIATGEREKVSAALLERIRKHGQIDYFPPEAILEKYFQDRRFFNNFYTPLILSNPGRKTVRLSSLVLVARATESKAVWVFTACVTVDPLKILDQTANQTDLWRAKGQFIGAAVEPCGSTEIHPWFIPITDSARRQLADGSMPPGSYEMRITGYGADNRRLFSTHWSRYCLGREQLIQAFAGNDALGNLVQDAHIDDALRDV